MARSKPPRKRYRPGPVLVNANARAMNAVTKLTPDEIVQAQGPLDEALAILEAGDGQAEHWAIVVDAMNVSEALAVERICSDEASRQTITEAQRALSRLHKQHAVLGSWVLWDEDREALHAGVELHRLQLSLCDYAEYRRAIDGVIRRMQAARAGSVAPGTTVLTNPHEAMHG